MNIYTFIILSALLLEFVLSVVVDLLNLKTLREPLPKEFEDVFSDEKYRTSQSYSRVRLRFGLVTASFNLTVTLLFWFLGGFNWIDHLVRQWNFSPIVTGDLFIGILLLGRMILSLPFQLYATFVIEERFGFNKTTIATFLSDQIKGLLLGLLIGGPLLTGVLAFFQFAGPVAWLYCWAIAALVTFIIQFLAPTLIMPLFNKFTPLEEGELRQAIFSYANSVNFMLKNIFIMDGSKRSKKSNAFFTGFGKYKRIALFDTLVEKHTTEELVAILAHEIGHYKKKHIMKGIVVSMLHMGVMFFLLSFFLKEQLLFDAFLMDQPSIAAGMIFFGLLFTPVEFLLSTGLNILSRKHEFEADRWAAETTHAPFHLMTALKKLSADNLSHLTPHPFYVFLHYSHPPVLQRIRSLQQ